MNNIAHRREYTRYTALFSTKYTLKEGMFRDLIVNISAGGVFFSTRRKIIQGRSINIQFPIFAFGKWLSVMGTVVRRNSKGFAVMFDEAIEVKILKEGRFPGNVNAGNQPTTNIDKNCVSQ